MPEVTDTFQPLDETSIREVERRLGFTLPDDLKNFYLAHNGGHLHPSSFVEGQDVF